MFTHEYEFEPGETAFAVIDNDCIKEVVILQYVFETYVGEEEMPVEKTNYLVKIHGEDKTVYVQPGDLYTSTTEALDAVDLHLITSA